jgi:hypothetical protein
MSAVPTSGVARRRTKAIRNRHRVEDSAFYRDGAVPPSATAAAICSCGARSFTRDPDGDLSDFAQAHDSCEEALS